MTAEAVEREERRIVESTPPAVSGPRVAESTIIDSAILQLQLSLNAMRWKGLSDQIVRGPVTACGVNVRRQC